MMWSSWLVTSLPAALMVVVSAAGMYVSMILLTRISGLRSFSKLSSFDFAVTVAIGSTLAGTVIARNPPLLQGVIALASLYGLQMLVAGLRRGSARLNEHIDNTPVLLMAGSRFLEENLRAARVTEGDLRAKLRAANVLSLDSVRAVVMETTGDISVLHGESDGSPLDLRLLEGVRGSEQLSQQPEAT